MTHNYYARFITPYGRDVESGTMLPIEIPYDVGVNSPTMEELNNLNSENIPPHLLNLAYAVCFIKKSSDDKHVVPISKKFYINAELMKKEDMLPTVNSLLEDQRSLDFKLLSIAALFSSKAATKVAYYEERVDMLKKSYLDMMLFEIYKDASHVLLPKLNQAPVIMKESFGVVDYDPKTGTWQERLIAN